MSEKVDSSRAGFTLIELLVVVTIIGVLAGIAVPNFMGAITRARVAKAFSEMRGLGNIMEMYHIDNGTYPTTSADLTAGGVYVAVLPRDPFNENGARTEASGALGTDGYGYFVGEGASAWLIVSNAPDGQVDVTSSGINWSQQMVGQLGGWEGADQAYGYHWYDPGSGLSSSGDIGVSGP